MENTTAATTTPAPIAAGDIVTITTENGGRIGGAVLRHAWAPPAREYEWRLGECAADAPGDTTIDTGIHVVTIPGHRIRTLRRCA